MLWSLDQDDYNGLFCGQGEFPLTRRVYDALRSSKNSNEQELVSSSITMDLSTEQNTDSFVSIALDTPEYRMLASTEFPFDWIFFNRSTKNICSFYLFFIVFFLI